ncbi:hypothetical protein V2V91_07390 [Microbacterium schleiferi]|uniref:Uncharacterized protein n=2 Tax=Microbacterium schleiferi TaxID=69362 RepID=A0ABU7V5J2_9MICO
MMRILMGAATPVPSPSETVNPDLVTPGPWGFLVIALLAVVVILLITDMMRRIRRGRVRADIREELDAEARAEAGADPDSATDDTDGEAPEHGAPERS